MDKQIRCQACGVESPRDSLFCERCDARIAAGKAQAEKAVAVGSALVGILALLMTIVFAGVLAPNSAPQLYLSYFFAAFVGTAFSNYLLSDCTISQAAARGASLPNCP
jgi:hypothetical protein